jgi:hypothetical protein
LNSLRHGTKLDFKDSPTMLLSIQTKSKGGWDISDANISPDGKWIAYTSVDTVVLFEINFDSVSHANAFKTLMTIGINSRSCTATI